jgi:hypothetical protein
MASKSKKSVSLGEEDRRYLNESLSEARRRTGAEVETSGLFEALESFGLSSDRVESLRKALGKVDVKEGVEKAQEYLAEQIEGAREYARENPKKVIGGAAGVLVGASLLALALRRAGGDDKKRRSSSPATPAAAATSSSSSKSSKSRKRSTGGAKKASSKKASKRR